jgi:hypothetical protein
MMWSRGCLCPCPCVGAWCVLLHSSCWVYVYGHGGVAVGRCMEVCMGMGGRGLAMAVSVSCWLVVGQGQCRVWASEFMAHHEKDEQKLARVRLTKSIGFSIYMSTSTKY